VEATRSITDACRIHQLRQGHRGQLDQLDRDCQPRPGAPQSLKPVQNEAQVTVVDSAALQA
jgi:hypothetical protein